ncbi:MAG: hypothetical protein J6R47_01155 [Acholeplasmatales bacterium]|nr:hypothetical protein [Acholeplasmatales bacterium]
MDNYLATEIAYKNGYHKALEEFEKSLKTKVDEESRWFGKYYKFSVFNSIDKTIKELRKDNINA